MTVLVAVSTTTYCRPCAISDVRLGTRGVESNSIRSQEAGIMDSSKRQTRYQVQNGNRVLVGGRVVVVIGDVGKSTSRVYGYTSGSDTGVERAYYSVTDWHRRAVTSADKGVGGLIKDDGAGGDERAATTSNGHLELFTSGKGVALEVLAGLHPIDRSYFRRSKILEAKRTRT